MASLLAFAAVHAAAPLLLPTTLSLLPSAAIAQQNPSPLFVQGPALPVPNASPQGIVPDRNAEWLEVDSNLAVAVHTGELWHRSTDVNIPARGMALEVRRVYRSQIAYGGPFGWNGSHNWDQRVMFDGSNLTHLDGERLVVDTYTPIAGGLWACQTPGLYRKARFDGARWQIRDRDGSIREFLALDGSPGEGRIESYTDPFGNAITCSYTAAGRLATLHDTVGRALTFAYNVHGVISSITDFGGRQTVYGYTGSDLTSVRTPVVVGTPVGPNGNNNDFPNGRETLFDYNNSHNLRKVKYPREVAANGAWNVTFTHNGDAVRTATTAGATLQLDFVSSSYPGAIGRTTLTDLRGFVTHYDCSAAGQVLAMEQVTAGLHANDPASFLTTNVHNAHGERTLVTRPSGEALYYFFDDQNVDLFQHGTVIDHVIVPASGAPGQQNPFGKTPIVDPVYQQLLTSSETGDKKYLDYQEATPAQNGLQTLLDDWDINTGSLDLSGLGDLNGDGIVNQIGGNVVRHDSRQITIGVATPVTIIRCSTYDAFGRLLTTTSGEGSLRVLEYGPDTAGGLLASYIDDANPEAHAPNAGTAFWNKPPTVEYVEAETTLARDQFGYVIAKTDARGVRRDYVRNVLGEILVSIEGAGVDASRLDPRLAALQTAGYGHLVAPGYEVWHRYDANGNRVRSDVENVGSGMGDAWITTTRTFDAWGRLERVTREVEPGKLLSWSLAHDANGRQTRVTRPKGDFDTWSYDERGLALDYVAGAADPATASQISYTYDLNSNLIEVTGPDDLDGNGKIDKYLQVFDGRDRLLSQIDPVGTEVRQTYDNYDTSLGYQVLGTSSGPSPTDNDTTGNVSLGEATQLLDEMDRVVQERRRLFLPAGQGGSLPFTVGNVWLETSFEYDRDNLPIVVTDPEGRIAARSYDGLGRQIGEVDGVGNVRARVYDAGGLLVQESVTEVNPLGASETKTYYRSYDGLGRLIRTVDNAGHAVYYANDSRDNHTAETDGRGPLVVDPLGQFADRVNAPGNLKRYVYDGLDRPVLSALDSAPGGEANGATDPWSASFDPSQQSAGATGAAVSSYGYDDNNNLESVVTGSGKVLGFDYDAQNRMVAKTFPDGSQLVFGYKKTGATASASLFDTSGNLFRRVDYAYDAAGRRIAENVTFTAGTPVGTLAREFEYNGLDRPTRMFDDNGAGADATVLAVYDSLRRLLQENQDGHLVSTQLDDTDMLSHLWFPSGRRVDYAYDQNGRLATIDESSGADIATFQYFGRGRLARIDLGNGVRHDLSTPSPNSMLPTGYDAAGRPKRAIHELIGGATLGELRFTYDRNHGRTKTESIITGSPTLADLFVYDSQGRLTDAGIDLFGGVAIDLLQRYDYQGDSNLDHRLVQAAGSPGSNYDHVDNADFGYQSIATLAIGHDVAGNRTSDVWMNYHFDGFDRLARINIRNLDGSDGPLVIEYTYDARGRRASKTDPTSGTTWYYHHGQRVIEERNSSNQLVAQYVHGYGLDDVLQMRRNLDGLPGYEPYYFLSDTRSSIVALTDDSGAVVERYAYDPSGFVRFLEADGSPATTGGMPRLRSAFANPRLYQAREYDHEIAVAKLGAALQGYVTEWTEPTGLYYYRARYHDPAEHRFVSRDPLAPASNNETDPSTLVMRMYTDGFIESPYVRGNNDPFVLDPSGLAAVDTYWVTGCIDNLKGAGRWVGKQGKRAGRGIKKGATWVSKRLPIAALAVSGVAGTAYGLINDSVAGYGECISAYIQDNLTLFSLGVNKALPKWLYANNFPKKCRKGILEVVFPPPAAPAPSQPAGPGGKGPGGPTTPGDNPGAPGGANPKKPFTPGGAPGAPGGNPGGPVTGPTTPGGTPGAPPECGGDGEGEGEDEGGEEEEPEGPTTGPRSAEDGFYLGHGQTCNKDLKGEKEEGNNGPNQSSSERKYGYLPGPASRHLVAFHAEAGRGAVTVAFAVREPADYVIVRGDREVGRGAAVPGRIIEVVDADGNATSSYSLQLATSSGAQVEVGAVRAATARSSAAERALAELAAGGDTGAVATESEVAAVAPATEEPETPGTRPAGWFQLLFLLVAALRLPSPLRR